MHIKITVIIPVYNVEKYLVQCLESVVNQTIPFDEVILINDGSTDKSLAICEKYTCKYSNFKLINQENRGLSAARNVGIKYASSKYIMFLDSDDYLRTDTIEILKSKLQEEKYEAIYFDADICCDDKPGPVRINIYDRKNANIDEKQMKGWEYFSKCYPHYFVVSACMAVYLKETIDKAGIRFPEGLYYEDNSFSIAFVNRALKVIHISEKLYRRRYRENSITTSRYSEKKFLDFLRVSMLVRDELSAIKNCEEFEKRDIQLKVASEYMNLILNNYKLCNEQGIVLSNNTNNIFENIKEQYVSLLNEKDWDFALFELPLLNKVVSNLCRIILLKKQCNEDIMQIRKELIECQKNLYVECLKKLPLNKKGIKVGIYGTGIHTEGMLAIYEKLIGEIKCNLIFLDSYRDTGIFRNRNIINYRQIDKSFSLIIISSFIYETEMMECIKNIMPESLLYTFYDIYNEDIFYLYDNYIQYF